MVTNCDVNKTEVICFRCPDASTDPKSFELCENIIHLTSSSKVLGITLDSKLNFKQHSKADVYNKLIYRWVYLSRYTNRNWGMNQKVLEHSDIGQNCDVFFPFLWLIYLTNQCQHAGTEQTLVYNFILEVILGISPLRVTNRIISVKHYLKVFRYNGFHKNIGNSKKFGVY